MRDFLHRYHKAIGAAALTLAVVVALGFVPWRAPDSWRDAAARRLALSIGAPDLSAGDARFTLLPAPRLTLANVAFAQNPGSISGRADEAVVHLSVFDLMAGRAKPAGLTLRRPDIVLRLAGANEKGFRDAIDVVSQVAGSLALGQVSAPLPRLDIDGGRITVSRGADANVLNYENARMRLRLPSLRDPIQFSFQARQGGADTSVSFTGATPMRVMARSREPLAFSYSGQGFGLEFEGDGVISTAPALNGKLALSSTAGALAAQGFPVSDQPGARVVLRSALDYSTRGANLADLKLSVGNDKYDGVGSVRHDGQRWHITGTLATEKSDLTALLSPLSSLRKTDGRWNDAAFDIDRLFSSSIDLRLSADRLALFGRTLEKVAVSVLTRPNRAEIAIGDAGWHKGALKLRASAAPGSFGLDVKLSGTLDKADLGSLAGDFLRERRLTGQGSINFQLETSGRSVAQFVTNADGRIAAMLRGGDVHGIDLNRLASRRAARGDLALAEALGGRTPYETASFSAKISNGAAQQVDGHMRAGRLVGTLQGSIDFGQAEHDLNGLVVQTPSDAQAAEPIPVLEFTVGGPLLEPRISPNVAAMQRRS